MKLIIELRSEKEINVENFDSVTYLQNSSYRTIKDDFSEFAISSDDTTYNFKGDSQISLNGRDIFMVKLI